MSSLVRRNLSQVLSRLSLARLHSVSPHTSGLNQQLLLLRPGHTAGLHSGVRRPNIRLQEEHFSQEPPAGYKGPSRLKLEEKLVRFLAKIDRDMKTNQRVLRHEVTNSFAIIEALNSCSANQALLMIKCHGEVNLHIFLFSTQQSRIAGYGGRW